MDSRTSGLVASKLKTKENQDMTLFLYFAPVETHLLTQVAHTTLVSKYKDLNGT